LSKNIPVLLQKTGLKKGLGVLKVIFLCCFALMYTLFYTQKNRQKPKSEKLKKAEKRESKSVLNP
jgi:uncharacterized ion transporter superfamily protein YfcC